MSLRLQISTYWFENIIRTYLVITISLLVTSGRMNPDRFLTKRRDTTFSLVTIH